MCFSLRAAKGCGLVWVVFASLAAAKAPEVAFASPQSATKKTTVAPLHEAVWVGDLRRTQQLLKAGADVNGKATPRPDLKNVTPLYIAAASPHPRPEIVNLLLKHGAITNTRNESNYSTPLMRAAGYGNAEIITLLIRNKANIEARDDLGRTALHYAAHGAAVKGVETLLYFDDYPGFVKARDKSGKTALLYAYDKTLNVEINLKANALKFNSAKDGDDIVRALLAKGADPNEREEHGWTALHFAAFGNSTTGLELLTQAGVYVDTPDHQGRTPLLIACEYGDYEAARWLLGHGADPDYRANTGKTPRSVVAEKIKAPVNPKTATDFYQRVHINYTNTQRAKIALLLNPTKHSRKP